MRRPKPPLPRSPSPFLKIVEEDTDMLLVGSIEVEHIEDCHKSLERIVCVPPEESVQRRSLKYLKSMSSILQVEDGIGQDHGDDMDSVEARGPDSLLDQITNVFLDSTGCSRCDCTPHAFKSALRKPGTASTPIVSGRNVSFSRLEIHEFDMTLGDHPSAVTGPPVALDYSKDRQRIVDLDDYEKSRTPRRTRKDMRLSYYDRKYILEKEKGFSTDQVNSAWGEALKIRHQRQESLHRGLFMMLYDEIAESAQRKYIRMLQSVGMAGDTIELEQ